MLQPEELVLPSFATRLSHAAARLLPIRLHKIKNTRPIVSFTFDDFPASAHLTAAPILESFGARSTFFTATGLLGKPHPLWKMADPDAVSDLADRDHEIALHTDCHAPVWQMSASALSAEIQKNLGVLQALSPHQRIENFAYPYGVLSVAGKYQMSRMTRANRSAHPGLNTGWVDLDFVRAYELSDARISVEQVRKILDAAVETSGWVVFFSHELSDSYGPFGTSSNLFLTTIKAVLERDLSILPFSQALDQIGVPRREVSVGARAVA